ncbi:hypothetical protein [Nesterenkonia marinintestina]|uniref:hypothetical protein n=1 Tax=Nesterenkonia marinintestina TaxID=2979865 RepID=UPI0021BECB48|nr:hypothetical protein [Nesterenkonia sp. GX14115]
MTVIAEEPSTTPLYRPGAPFCDEELQSLRREGALRHLLGDVYAPRTAAPTPELRAAALRRLLSTGEITDVVLCGETAGWLHLGEPDPRRLTVISSRFRSTRRQDVMARQCHQIRLQEGDSSLVAGIRVTTPLRTAADLVLGIGTVDTAGLMTAGTHDPRRRELIAALIAVHPDQADPKRVEDLVSWQLSLRGETADRREIGRTLTACLA